MRRHGDGLPPAVREPVDVRLGEARAVGLQPTAEIFNRQAEKASRIFQRIREAIRAAPG